MSDSIFLREGTFYLGGGGGGGEGWGILEFFP